MDIATDVLVIGGGMAGLVAGAVAAESGQKTVLLRKGLGATAMSSGAIDVIGYLPDGNVPIMSPIDGLQALTSLHLLHPYSILGYTDAEPSQNLERILTQIAEIVTWLKENLASSVAPLIGDIRRNLFPITVLGTTKPTCLIQETMFCDDLNESSDNVLLFAGIRGHPDFQPGSAASVYLENRAVLGESPKKVGHCVLDIAPFGKPYNVSSIEIARHLDHPGAIDSLVEEMKTQVDLVGASHVALPPVIGLKRAKENRKKLEEAVGVKVFELLSFPPSVPGHRLQMALEQLFLSKGGTMMMGFEATGSEMKEQQVISLSAKGPRRRVEIRPKVVVLASGKYIGGGLYATEHGLKETVFNLMTVTESFYSAHDMRPPHHTSILAVSSDGHEVFGSGLSIDTTFRPVDMTDHATAHNLFAAGSILAGYNYATEKSGLGVALVSGHIAGSNAAHMAKEVT